MKGEEWTRGKSRLGNEHRWFAQSKSTQCTLAIPLSPSPSSLGERSHAGEGMGARLGEEQGIVIPAHISLTLPVILSSENTTFFTSKILQNKTHPDIRKGQKRAIRKSCSVR